MKAKFYTISDYPNALQKHEINSSADISIEAYESIDDLNGYIIVSPKFYDYNYVRLTWDTHDSMSQDESATITVERYYFIESREMMTGERLKLKLHEDVLFTFQQYIYNIPAIVGRTQSGYINANLISDMPTENFKETQFMKIGDEMVYDPTHYVLVTSGGGTVS